MAIRRNQALLKLGKWERHMATTHHIETRGKGLRRPPQYKKSLPSSHLCLPSPRIGKSYFIEMNELDLYIVWFDEGTAQAT